VIEDTTDASERVCFLYELEAGAAAEYEQRHRAVWPELLILLADAGVTDYSIFCRGELLICVLRATPDWATARRLLRDSPVQARWTASLQHLFRRLVDDAGEELRAREVFRFDP
jgi:L-rhamnose mutarotase